MFDLSSSFSILFVLGFISKFKNNNGKVKYLNSTRAVGTKTNIVINVPPMKRSILSLESNNKEFEKIGGKLIKFTNNQKIDINNNQCINRT